MESRWISKLNIKTYETEFQLASSEKVSSLLILPRVFYNLKSLRVVIKLHCNINVPDTFDRPSLGGWAWRQGRDMWIDRENYRKLVAHLYPGRRIFVDFMKLKRYQPPQMADDGDEVSMVQIRLVDDEGDGITRVRVYAGVRYFDWDIHKHDIDRARRDGSAPDLWAEQQKASKLWLENLDFYTKLYGLISEEVL